MKEHTSREDGSEGLGPELEALLAKVPPPQAPAWLTAKTLARLRQQDSARGEASRPWLARWRWVWAAGAAGLVAGWILWDRPQSGVEISDAVVFAGLDALVEQEEENRWWAGL